MTPDVVEDDNKKMTKPAFDLILGCKTMKEIGILVDFQTKQETIDEIIFPIRDINSLTTSKMERTWAVNNIMVQEPRSTQEVTQ